MIKQEKITPDEMKKIVIVGASGHGGMVLECIEKDGKYCVLGFLDSYKKKETSYCGYNILGTEQDLPQLIAEQNLFGVIIAIGNNWTRKKMMDKLIAITPNLNFITVIHPNAVISKRVEIGKGTVIMQGVLVNSNAKIGNFCILNTNSSLGHDGAMEDYSSISSGVCTGGNLMLGEFSAISLGVNIIENITIGAHSVIGAGSLVLNDVMENTVVFGSPAQLIRHRSAGEPYLTGDTLTFN